MLGLESGDLAKCAGDAFAVALVIVALITQEHDTAGELRGKLLDQVLLRTEVTIEVEKESLVAAGLAQSMSDLTRRAELGLVSIGNIDAGKVGVQGGLREPAAA